MMPSIDSLLSSIAVLVQIIAVDLLLGGDNAIVVALAARRLRADLLGRAALLGTIGAIAFRLLLATIASALLDTPYLKIVCGLLLVAIAIRLLSSERRPVAAVNDPSQTRGNNGLWAAVGLMLAADAIMSLDNIVAVAAIANGSLTLLAIGFALSIPMIVYGGAILAQLIGNYQNLALAGAVIIGWVGGALAVSDVAVAQSIAQQAPALSFVTPLLCAIFVFAEGRARGLGAAIAPEAQRSVSMLLNGRSALPARASLAPLGSAPAVAKKSQPRFERAQAPAAARRRRADPSEALEGGNAKIAEEKVILIGLLVLFLLAGALVAITIYAGGGIADARG